MSTDGSEADRHEDHVPGADPATTPSGANPADVHEGHLPGGDVLTGAGSDADVLEQHLEVAAADDDHDG